MTDSQTQSKWGVREEVLEDQGSERSNSTLTGFIVLHGFLLKILEYVQPELLFQAITVVSKKALQTISVGEHKSVRSGLLLHL